MLTEEQKKITQELKEILAEFEKTKKENSLINDKEFVPMWARPSVPQEYKEAIAVRRKIGTEDWEIIRDKNGQPITAFFPSNDKNVSDKPC